MIIKWLRDVYNSITNMDPCNALEKTSCQHCAVEITAAKKAVDAMKPTLDEFVAPEVDPAVDTGSLCGHHQLKQRPCGCDQDTEDNS